MHLENLFENILPDASKEEVSVLLQTPGWQLERIVSTGQGTANGEWYDQIRNEWVILLTGSARLRFAEPEESLNMKPGDWLEIPAHRRHRVEATSGTEASVWLALHYSTHSGDEPI